MPYYRFKQVDVFSTEPLMGNPLAVVLDAEGMDTATMRAFARWTNLSETAFVIQPSDPRADYRLRIFNADGEMEFAGHPTLGSCHAWLEVGGQPKGRRRCPGMRYRTRSRTAARRRSVFRRTAAAPFWAFG